MTPEEKAVIEAAIRERNTLGRLFDTSPITQAVDALLRKQAFLSDGGAAIIREVDPDSHGAMTEPSWTPAT